MAAIAIYWRLISHSCPIWRAGKGVTVGGQTGILSPMKAIITVLIFGLFASSTLAHAAEFYDPLEQQIEGWTVAVDPQLLSEANQKVGREALKALANHLQRVRYIVPPDRLKELQKLRLWIDWEHDLGNMQYHPDRGWLIEHGYDPRLVKHVHIPRARQLLDPGQWAKHPYAVLHELAHSFHDQIMGFDHPKIVDAFEQMKSAGIYDDVLVHTGRREKHYGLSNHKEYFAESTEAYFGVNDFYPFVRAELREHDATMFALMEEVWGKVK